RDIKPENILVARDGLVKVADFGVARAADYSMLTGTGIVIGTLRYMAPEIITGDADARSDIYSLGIVLYELLAGSPPFDAPLPWELIRLHRDSQPPPLQLRVRGATPDIEALIAQ